MPRTIDIYVPAHARHITLAAPHKNTTPSARKAAIYAALALVGTTLCAPMPLVSQAHASTLQTQHNARVQENKQQDKQQAKQDNKQENKQQTQTSVNTQVNQQQRALDDADATANPTFKNAALTNNTLDVLEQKLTVLPKEIDNNARLKQWETLGNNAGVEKGTVKTITEFGGWHAVDNGKFAIARKSKKGIFPLETINSTLDDNIWLREQALDRENEYMLFLTEARTRASHEEAAYDDSTYLHKDQGPKDSAKALKGYNGIEKTFNAYAPEHGSDVTLSFKTGYTGDIEGSKAQYKVEVFTETDNAKTRVYETVVDPSRNASDAQKTVTKATNGTSTNKLLKISNTAGRDASSTKQRIDFIGKDAAEEKMTAEENKPNGKPGTFTSTPIVLPKGVSRYSVRISLADNERTGMSYQAWDRKYALPIMAGDFTVTQTTKQVAKHIFSLMYDKLVATKDADIRDKSAARVKAYEQQLEAMKKLVDAADAQDNSVYVDAWNAAKAAKNALSEVATQPRAVGAAGAAGTTGNAARDAAGAEERAAAGNAEGAATTEVSGIAGNVKGAATAAAATAGTEHAAATQQRKHGSTDALMAATQARAQTHNAHAQTQTPQQAAMRALPQTKDGFAQQIVWLLITAGCACIATALLAFKRNGSRK